MLFELSFTQGFSGVVVLREIGTDRYSMVNAGLLTPVACTRWSGALVCCLRKFAAAKYVPALLALYIALSQTDNNCTTVSLRLIVHLWVVRRFR